MALNYVAVRVAHPCSLDLKLDMAGLRFRHGYILWFQALLGVVVSKGFHVSHKVDLLVVLNLTRVLLGNPKGLVNARSQLTLSLYTAVVGGRMPSHPCGWEATMAKRTG